MVEVAFTVDVEGITVEALVMVDLAVATLEVEALRVAELVVDGLIEAELDAEGLIVAVDMTLDDLAAVVATAGP